MAPKFDSNTLRQAERMFRGALPRALTDGDEIPINPDGSKMSIRERDFAMEADGRFHDRNMETQSNNQHLSPSALFSNVLSIVYPSIEHYGPQHGARTSQLAVYIAQVEGVRSERDLEVLKNAALMHDVGRREPMGKEDRGHNMQSALMADRIMRADPTATRLPDMREAVCRLIAAHSIHWKDPPTDPLLRALHDADSLESARYGSAHRQLVSDRYRRLLSPWCQREATQARWMKKYGW